MHLNHSLKRPRNHFFTLVLFLLLLASYLRRGLLDWASVAFSMGTKMKGIYKGFKYISQIFVVKEREMDIGYPTDVKHVAHIGWDGGNFAVVKEREMDIGYPTDVKHVAHIGWDGTSGSAPSWMNEFKTGPDFAETSIGNSGSALSPWSSQDFGESMQQQPASEMFRDIPPTDLPNIPKKPKRKKNRSTSSPKSSSSSRGSRAAKSKAKFVEGNAQSTNIEVA
ncbi:unnamed protein product [Ilex paraguariensis]|uniref:CRIB domain-containing protein n=1 Tax=Ilex paraguariensis TaxID=185542 RepID=A0ABC8RPB9_9AQUA